MSKQKRKNMCFYKIIKIKTRNIKDLKAKLKHCRPLKGKSNEIKINRDHNRRKKYDKLILKMDDQTKINIVKYIVKLFAYFEYENIDMETVASGFIIDVDCDSIWVLTCAHVVKIYDRIAGIWYGNNQNNAPYICKIQSDTFEDKPIRTWTCDDVEEWLISLGTKFERKCIDEIVNQLGLDGDALCDMDDSDWNEVHINKILKNIIKKKINELKCQ